MAKRPKVAGITNAVILQHLQGMRQSLEGRMGKFEGRMGNGFAEVHSRLGRVEQDVGEIKKDVRNINDALQRLYAHRVNMLGRIDRLEETVGIA